MPPDRSEESWLKSNLTIRKPVKTSRSTAVRSEREVRSILAGATSSSALTAAIARLMPSESEIKERAHSDNPETYIRQLQVIGVDSQVREDAVEDFMTAFLVDQKWTQENTVDDDVLTAYHKDLLKRHRAIATVKRVTNNPEKNKEIGREVFAKTMDAVSDVKPQDCTLWVPRTSEGMMHQFANDPLDDNFITWHPDYDHAKEEEP